MTSGNYQHKKGYKLSEKTRKKQSEATKKRHKENQNFGFQKGHNYNKIKKGTHQTEEHKRKISEAKKGKQPKNSINWKGKNHPHWKGGISFEPYGLEFNEDLREVIRNRDRRKCQVCDKTELENKGKLHCHHIDYNKRNNDPNNLITLCKKCHTKTNFNRNYWIKYFNGR